MRQDVNNVLLIGNLVADATIKATATGKAVANFRVATNASFGETKITDYHNIVCWEKLAEEAQLRARVGVRVIVEGRLKTRHYESKKHEGEKVYVTEVVADSVRYMDFVEEEDLTDITFSS